MRLQEARALLDRAEVICDAASVQAALTRLAGEIRERLSERFPLVFCVMNGGLVFCGQLLPKLDFPLDVDYLHATRYGAACEGGNLCWRVEPTRSVAGRSVLVVDDILDEGLTLAAIRDSLLAQGAAEVLTVVLADKRHGRPKPLQADFVGLEVPDRFVFGFGMDAGGAWRNLPAIYAVREAV